MTATQHATKALHGLADDYLELAGRTVESQVANYSERVSGGAAPRLAPTSVRNLDKMTAVETFAAFAYRLGTATIGSDHSCLKRAATSGQATIAKLRWTAEHLEAIDRASATACRQIADDCWQVVRRLGPEAEVGGRPFRLDVVCPHCQLPSLWAEPTSGRVACGMPDCGAEWTTSEFARETEVVYYE